MAEARRLLVALVQCSERAANIARRIRENGHLFALLVCEKSEEEANPRFVKDFKTLADVLIQQMIRKYIGDEFPELRNSIKGEEDPKFCNALGETIVVEVLDDIEATATLLEGVLDGDKVAASLLAAECHADVAVDDLEIPPINEEVDISNLAIWIDPIDATAEYIKGEAKETKFAAIPAAGLQCVTILLGCYLASSGEPIIGVINQPFAHEAINRIVWGVCLNETRLSNVQSSPERSQKIAILSSSEQTKFTKFLKQKMRYEICYSAGAGHKLLKLITGDADLNLLSRGTTFKWDTCAPQAILKAIGGNVLNLNSTIFSGNEVALNYSSKEPNCNIDGILAYREPATIANIISVFSGK